jgi:hypothetical protein
MIARQSLIGDRDRNRTSAGRFGLGTETEMNRATPEGKICGRPITGFDNVEITPFESEAL